MPEKRCVQEAARAMVIAAVLWVSAPAAQAQIPPPILDVHLHALPVSETGEAAAIAICAPFEEWLAWDPAQQSYDDYFSRYTQGTACDDPVWSAETDGEVMRQTIEVMERRNIYGVLSGPPERVEGWRSTAPGRFLPALRFNVDADDDITPDSLRQLVASGQVEVFGEIWNWYDGIPPDDPRMEPYWALAEELDVPVGYHLNGGRPGEPHAGYGARMTLVSALTMEEVLVRHPRLRVYLMHAGYPLLEDLLAVLYAHPQVYIDVSATILEPRPAFYRYLQAIVEAGFADRVMFGSDQWLWPGVIEKAIAVIQEAPFLSEEQKRDILYNNAARFFRLSREEIARHHRG